MIYEWLKRYERNRIFWRINQFRILELCVNCQHLVWTALSGSRLGWVVGVKCWRCWPKVPARCIVFITRPMSRTSSFLPPPVTMSQAVDRNSKNWLDFKETFTARVGTINEYMYPCTSCWDKWTPVLKDRGYTSRADIKIMKCPICHPFKTMWKLADKSSSSEWRQHGPERRWKT